MTLFRAPNVSTRQEGSFQPAKQRRAGTKVIYYFLGAAALIGWLYVLFMSDVFAINAVEVQGVKNIDPVDLNREALQILDERPQWRPWTARHAWFVDRSRLADQLTKHYFLARADVSISYTNVLRLKIEEQAHTFIFQSHQQYVWVDLQGSIINELTPDERKQAQARILGTQISNLDDPSIVHHDMDERLVIGGRVADEHQIKTWLQIASQTILEGMRYREFEPPMTPSSTRAIFKSEEGESVVVDLVEPIRPQIHAYLTFKKNQPKNLKVTEYVDVRILGKVYVK